MTLLTKVVASSPAGYATPLLAILLPKGGLPESLGPLDHQTGGILQRVIAAGDFTGKRDDAVLCHPPGPAGRVLLVGLGPAADRQASDIRRGAAVAAKRARQVGAPAMGHLRRSRGGVADRDGAGASVAALPVPGLTSRFRRNPPEPPLPTVLPAAPRAAPRPGQKERTRRELQAAALSPFAARGRAVAELRRTADRGPGA